MSPAYRKYPFKRKRIKTTLIKTAIYLILFGLFCFVKVWQNVRVDQMSRRNGALRSQLKELKEGNASLTAEMEKLKRRERIKNFAETRLKLDQVPVLTLDLYPDNSN